MSHPKGTEDLPINPDLIHKWIDLGSINIKKLVDDGILKLTKCDQIKVETKYEDKIIEAIGDVGRIVSKDSLYEGQCPGG